MFTAKDRTWDNLELQNGKLTGEAAIQAESSWRKRMFQDQASDRVRAPVLLSSALSGVIEQIQVLKKKHPNPNPNPNPKQVKFICTVCKGDGFIRRDLPPNHPQFGRAVPCPKCSNITPWGSYQELIESMFPVPAHIKDLAHAPLDVFSAKTKELALETRKILTEWPMGSIIAIDGGYGTGKSHVGAIVYCKAWEKEKGAIYIESAQRLQDIFTSFDKEAARKNIRIQAAMSRFDTEASEELIEEEMRLTFSRKELSQRLVAIPYLIIDEAHRYTRKGGNGWVEMKMADLINARFMRKKTTILLGNGMGDGHIIGEKGPYSLHSSILDRCRSGDCRWIDLNGVPSGRHRYARNAGNWWE